MKARLVSLKSNVGLLLKDSLWYLAGTAFSRGSFLVTNIFIARFLGETGFGKYSIIKSTLNSFTLFAILGLTLTATKFVSEFNNRDNIERNKLIRLINSAVVISSIVIALGLFFASTYVARMFFDDVSLAPYLKIVSLGIVVVSIANIAEGIILGLREFKLTTSTNVVASIISFVFTLILTFYFGIAGAIIGFLFFPVIKIFLYYKWLKKELGVLYSTKIEEFKRFFNLMKNFSLPAFISALLTSPVTWYVNTLLVRLPNGYTELAFYSAGVQWNACILMLTGAVANVALPHLSGVKKKNEYKNSLNSALLINLCVAVLLAIPIIIASKFIMSLYGEEFAEHYLILIVLISATVFTSVNSVFIKAYASKNKMWSNLIINLIVSIMLVGGSYLVVDEYMALGVAFVYLMTYVIEMGIRKAFLKY